MARSRDGVEIAYETHGRTGGDAPAVVLVHGWAGDRTYWDGQVDLLAEWYHVVAVDLGGHGESGVGREDWNLPAFGDDVAATVEEVGAREVALVGHSMGGDAILFAACSLGDRVRGLVWVDAFRSLGDEPISSTEDVAAFVAPFREDFGVAVDRFARNLFPEGADGALVDRIAGDMAAAPREATTASGPGKWLARTRSQSVLYRRLGPPFQRCRRSSSARDHPVSDAGRAGRHRQCAECRAAGRCAAQRRGARP